MRLLPFSPILVALLVLFCAEAGAHPGHKHPVEEVDEFDLEAFFSAAAHPFTGLDHLIAMLAVGALAFGGRRGVGIAFGGAVGVGFVMGLTLPPWIPGLSLVVIGGFILKGVPMTKAWLHIVVAMIGIIHGGAHAAGMSGLTAGAGLFAGTMVGVGLGVVAARGLRRLPPIAVRFAGASVAVIGALLTVTRFSL
jgi:urease accessory protein